MARLLVRPEAVDADHVRFDAAEARHMSRVLRLRRGAVVEATDGTGRLYTVRLGALDAAGAWGVIEGRAEPRRESACALTLAQAVLKGDRMSWLVQKATELGVARIVPVLSGRVVARPRPGEAGRHARWQRIAREAVKQCGRLVVPAVDAPRPLADVIGEAARHELAWLFWERGGAPIHAARPAAGTPASVLLLVGPEGGFAPDEVALARDAGVRLVSLGPRILRGESAGLAAVTLCQFLFGDLGAGVGAAGDVAGRPPGGP
jgi:16S rRNA (uracil1498-N3)-methyltransferase